MARQIRTTIKKNFRPLLASCRRVKDLLLAGKPAAALRCTLSALADLIDGTLDTLLFLLDVGCLAVGVAVTTVFVQHHNLHVDFEL